MAAVVIVLISFVGIYTQKENRMENQVKEYQYSKDLDGYREVLLEVTKEENIKLKKIKPQKLGVLDSDEVLLLLAQPDVDDLKGLRDKAMLELLYATGIKVSELLQVKLNDINLTIGILHLKSQTKERIVPIYPAALKSIAQYIQNVRPAFVSDENQEILFLLC